MAAQIGNVYLYDANQDGYAYKKTGKVINIPKTFKII
jgi:hypothetical protein